MDLRAHDPAARVAARFSCGADGATKKRRDAVPDLGGGAEIMDDLFHFAVVDVRANCVCADAGAWMLFQVFRANGVVARFGVRCDLL